MVLDPEFQSLDRRGREVALLEVMTDLFDGLDAEWLIVREQTMGGNPDVVGEAEEWIAAAEVANSIDAMSFSACGFPALAASTTLSTPGCPATAQCELPDVWAATIPCYEVETTEIELVPDPPLVWSLDEYLPTDCDSGERIELDRGGTWKPTISLEQALRMTTVWVTSAPIPAGTTAEEVIADGLLVETYVDIADVPPIAIVDPAAELAGLAASRDLPADHILEAGDFLLR